MNVKESSYRFFILCFVLYSFQIFTDTESDVIKTPIIQEVLSQINAINGKLDSLQERLSYIFNILTISFLDGQVKIDGKDVLAPSFMVAYGCGLSTELTSGSISIRIGLFGITGSSVSNMYGVLCMQASDSKLKLFRKEGDITCAIISNGNVDLINLQTNEVRHKKAGTLSMSNGIIDLNT